jgi:threonine/homoserine/homoserine lactone efflux protein
MGFLPDHQVLALFSAASVLLIFTPGPDMTYFLGQTLAGGSARGFMALAGACTGLVAHAVLAAFGLSALLLASASAFTAVKMAGAGYLLWLAVQAIRQGSAITLCADKGAGRPFRRVYAGGVAINLLNPKIVMFFVTFLPQFVSAGDPHAPGKLFVLGITFIVLCLPICVPMILFADRFTRALQRSPRAMRIVDWLLATVFGVFAVRLLFARAN